MNTLAKDRMEVCSRLKNYNVLRLEHPDFLCGFQPSPNDFILVDALVCDLFQGELEPLIHSSAHVIRLEAGESTKTLNNAEQLIQFLLEKGATRSSRLISVGGGTIHDVAGFVASVVLRGIPWLLIPTTLLSQADSCLGGKTGVNHKSFKNRIGTIYPPDEVLIWNGFLETLPHRELHSGLGEVLKALILQNSELETFSRDFSALFHDFDLLGSYAWSALLFKKRMVEADELDQSQRMHLNFGHTIGHALESAFDFALPHGIAVTYGMDAANYISWKLGVGTKETYMQMNRLLMRNVVTDSIRTLRPEQLIHALLQDKKNQKGQLRMVLLDLEQKPLLHSIPDPEHVFQALQEWFAQLYSDNVQQPT